MKRLAIAFALFLGLSCSALAQSGPVVPAPAKKPRHALTIAVQALATPVMHPKAAVKITLKGISDGIAVGIRGTEAVVDVVHLGTAAIAGPVPSPFFYVNKVVGYADTGLEKGYKLFWNADI